MSIFDANPITLTLLACLFYFVMCCFVMGYLSSDTILGSLKRSLAVLGGLFWPTVPFFWIISHIASDVYAFGYNVGEERIKKKLTKIQSEVAAHVAGSGEFSYVSTDDGYYYKQEE